jgi:hypothetical protein
MIKRDFALRDARKARLSDAGLLEIFMASRKNSLADGCSIVEANERAHTAVEVRLGLQKTVNPA